MNREETAKILSLISVAYPNYHVDNKAFTINAWMVMLENYTYEQVELGVKNYITTDKSGFAPSIGQVIDKIHVASDYQVPSALEEWGNVMKAVRNSTYNSQSEWEKLSPTVQAVISPQTLREWAMQEYFNESSAQKDFTISYNTQIKREAELRRLPQQTRDLIQSTTKMMLEAN